MCLRFFLPEMKTVLIVGSSIFEQWTTVGDALPGFSARNAAVGGTTTAYWVAHLPPLLAETAPCAVLFYCGSNDLNIEVPEARIVANLERCFAQIPEGVPLAYCGIIKAPQKRGKWELIERINQQARALLPTTGLYLEANTVFFPDGAPQEAFFVEDGLHLTDAAYSALGGYAAPLLASWLNGVQ